MIDDQWGYAEEIRGTFDLSDETLERITQEDPSITKPGEKGILYDFPKIDKYVRNHPGYRQQAPKGANAISHEKAINSYKDTVHE